MLKKREMENHLAGGVKALFTPRCLCAVTALLSCWLLSLLLTAQYFASTSGQTIVVQSTVELPKTLTRKMQNNASLIPSQLERHDDENVLILRSIDDWSSKVWSQVNLTGYPNVLDPDVQKWPEEKKYPLPWGSLYPHRVWCGVPSMWPTHEKRMRAIARTWGPLCDHLVFFIDTTTTLPPTPVKRLQQVANQSGNAKHSGKGRPPKANPKLSTRNKPSHIEGFSVVVLNTTFPQNDKARNIWEKSWKMWRYLGQEKLDEADWFLKIDDDTFFSAINFKGFVRYLNPEQPYYLGHTLMHLWKSRNIVFNAGSCYALSRASLRVLTPVFSSSRFLRPKRVDSRAVSLCIHRRGQFEDPSLGACLHMFGIEPLDTTTAQHRDRFSPLNEVGMFTLRKGDWWYFRHKPKEQALGPRAAATYPIAFHYYKQNSYYFFTTMSERHNIKECNLPGLVEWRLARDFSRLETVLNTSSVMSTCDSGCSSDNVKVFQAPQQPKLFAYDKDSLKFEIDKYRNTLKPPREQLIPKGDMFHPYCFQCGNQSLTVY